jgi:DNA-binding transcriptional MerR regulator
MTTEHLRLNPDEAAAASRMDVRIVWRYADLGLIIPSPEGYTDENLAELRRVRRLQADLELDHPAIEIILRMRQHIHALQAEIRQLEQALRATRRAPRQPNWVEAEWDERL